MSKIKEQPIPQGKYLPAVRHANIIYTSGMTPRKTGKLMYSGVIQLEDALDSHKEAVRLSAMNALIAAQFCLKEGENIGVILQLNIFLNAEQGFTQHSKIADFASEVLIEQLGTNSIGSRAAIGVASLPSNAPVEITLVALVN